jgi:hypothetical protein
MNAGVKKSEKEMDPTVLGVVSTSPGMLIGHIEDSDSAPVMVALAGRVPVKVTMENGPIKKGDYLTPSPTPGKAMKATKAGIVIGQAMTEYTDPDTPGIVVAFIKQGPSNGSKLTDLISGLTIDGSNENPDTTSTDIASQSSENSEPPTPVIIPTKTIQQQALAYFNTGRALLEKKIDLSEVFADRVTAGLEVITPELYANNINTDTIKASNGTDIGLVLSDNGKFTIGGQTTNTITNPDGTTKTTTSLSTPVITFDSFGNAMFAGTLTAKEIRIGDISGIANITEQINNLAEGQQAFTLTAQAMNTLSSALTIAQADILKLKDDLALVTQSVSGLTTTGTDLDSRLKIIEGS